MTRKLHDMMSWGLEWSRVVWKDQEKSRDKVMLGNILTAWLPHGIHMVHAWMTEIKSRV